MLQQNKQTAIKVTQFINYLLFLLGCLSLFESPKGLFQYIK